jgi:dipeptidyl-peptidase-4
MESSGRNRIGASLLALLGVGVAAGAATSQQEAPRLTIERLHGDPDLDGGSPRGLAIAPDGSVVTFLKPKEEDSEVLDLWAYDAATGEERLLVDSTVLDPDETELSEEEKARRERMRIRDRGIVSYEWDERGRAVLVPAAGDLFYVEVTGQTKARRITHTEAFETDGRISPAGRYVSYVRDRDVFAFDLETGEERALTTGGEEPISHGMAEFVVQEELGRFTGYWWSWDDRYVAYFLVDESPVDVVERIDVHGDSATVVPQRYPRAGRPNAVSELFVLDLRTGESVRADLGEDRDVYFPRVDWMRRTSTLVVQRLNRDQTRLDLLAVDPVTGASRTLLRETAETWINVTDGFTPFESRDGFLWLSERDGFRHVYLHRGDGTLERQVTAGPWVVSEIAGVDETAGLVYFVASRDTPLESHLYVASYVEPGSEPRRITPLGRVWSVTMPRDARGWVGKSSHPSQPPQVGLYAASGERIRWIEENALDEDHPYTPFLSRHVEPEFGTTEAEDGSTLHYSILRPPHCTAESSCPAIQKVYGGPHGQTVKRSWTGATDQLHVQQGFVVFRIDNRGSWNRGHAFEEHLHRRMGQVEVRDQLVGTRLLKALPFVDLQRVGVYGWSYGGYMTLLLLGHAPDAFAAGIAGAPVTDWSVYDTAYTERYMERPQDNPEGYEAGSVFPYLRELGKTPFLVVHGMADDNVIFEHTSRLLAALQERDVPFEVMLYPGQRHGVAGKMRRMHLMRTQLAFWERTLRPVPVP